MFQVRPLTERLQLETVALQLIYKHEDSKSLICCLDVPSALIPLCGFKNVEPGKAGLVSLPENVLIDSNVAQSYFH